MIWNDDYDETNVCDLASFSVCKNQCIVQRVKDLFSNINKIPQ